MPSNTAKEVRSDYQDMEARMKDLVTFYLTVTCRSPSKEKSFLGKGWGIRDVRGPYLDGFVGHIHIASGVLSSKTPSTVFLVLSVSNRYPTSFVLARGSTVEKEASKKVKRNGSADFIIDSVYAHTSENLELLVQLPEVQTNAELDRFWTILAIDEITIERY